MWLLNATRCWCRLASCLGCQLLSWCLTTSGFTCSLFSACHFVELGCGYDCVSVSISNFLGCGKLVLLSPKLSCGTNVTRQRGKVQGSVVFGQVSADAQSHKGESTACHVSLVSVTSSGTERGSRRKEKRGEEKLETAHLSQSNRLVTTTTTSNNDRKRKRR